jgi:hypothetical protein
MYDIYQQRIAECDRELEQHLTRVADKVVIPAPDSEHASTPRSEGVRRRQARESPSGTGKRAATRRNSIWAVSSIASAAST